MTLKASYLNILSQLDASTTIVTPNRRLSALLHKLHHFYQQEKRATCWHTPDILPLATFLERLWLKCINEIGSSDLLLLNSLQTQFLWEKILLSSKASDTLLQVSETADMALSAWDLLKAWQVDLSLPDFTETHEHQMFQQWAYHFQTTLSHHSLLEVASLPDFLANQLSRHRLIQQHHLILIGFNEISPQLNYFLTCYKIQSNKVTILKPTLSSATCLRSSFKNEEDEILHIARFTKALFTKQPTTNIGCVFPSLEKKRERIFQIFSQVFAENNDLMCDPYKSPFNISAGKPLLKYPIIQIAIQLLSLHKKIIPIDNMSYLLTSAFLGEAESEKYKRAFLDTVLRKENLHTLHVDQILFLIRKECPALAKRFNDFFNELGDMTQVQSYENWSKKFNDLLTLFGFPGERSLNSQEYQIVEQFINLLFSLNQLDQILPPTHYLQALNTLTNMAAKQIFQFKTPDAPIQILGLLEAAALPFDHLFIAEMHDVAWPPKANPNPLIPKTLQRRLQMPHASPERELVYCQTLTEQFINSAQQILFTHAEQSEEIELQASPLIRHFPLMSIETYLTPRYQALDEKIYALKRTEKLIDNEASAIQSKEVIHGGAAILKRQSLCPFKALAESRLHAHAIETPLAGLRAKDRGILLHKALEHVWNRIKDQQTLLALPQASLQQHIAISIDMAFNFLFNFLKKIPTHQQYYYQLEKQRLTHLINAWLQIEKTRPAFTVIMQEKTTHIQFENFTLTLRIDRVDELADGKKLIIDYKTNHQQIGDWFSKRMEEPQLPLYATIDPTHTIGVSFAEIHAGHVGFKGISQYTLDIKGIKLLSDIKQAHAANWQEQLNAWKNDLYQLINHFSSGQAAVSPKEESVCFWCSLKPFCRREETI